MQRPFLTAFVVLLCFAWSANAAGKNIEELKWIRMESPNFAIHSTLSKRRTREMLEYLEAVHAIFIGLSGNQPVSTVPTDIYVLKNEDDYGQLVPNAENTAGKFFAGLRRNTIIMRDSDYMRESEIVVHEYVHYLMYNLSRFPYPKWYDEGFAEYIANSKMQSRQFRIGLPDMNSLYWLDSSKWLPMETIIDSAAFRALNDKDVSMAYVQSWLLTHFLHSADYRARELSDAWREFRESLRKGDEEVDAFENAFGVNLDELTELLEDYSRKRKFGIYTLPIEQVAVDIPLEAERMSQPAISIKLAGALRDTFSHRERSEESDAEIRSTIRRLYDNALQNESTRGRANIGIAMLLSDAGQYEAAERHMIDGVAEAPGEFFAQLDAANFWLRQIQSTEGERKAELLAIAERHLLAALAIDNSHPELVFATGIYFLAEGNIELAIERIRLAAQAAPAVNWVRDWLIRLLIADEQYELALQYARDLLAHSHDIGENRQALLELIESIEEKSEAPTLDSGS